MIVVGAPRMLDTDVRSVAEGEVMFRTASACVCGLVFACASQTMAQDEPYRFTFEPTHGDIRFVVPNGVPRVRLVRLQSALDLFTGEKPAILEGTVNVFQPDEIFKLDIAKDGFSELDFGPVVATETSASLLHGSLCVDVVPITGGLYGAVLEDVSSGTEFTVDTCLIPIPINDPIEDPGTPVVVEPKPLMSSAIRVSGLVESPLPIIGTVADGVSPFHDLPTATISNLHGFTPQANLISLPASDVGSDIVFHVGTNGIATFHVAVESGTGPLDWMTPEFTGLPTNFFRHEAGSLTVGFDGKVPDDRSYEIWSTSAGAGTFRFGSAPDGRQIVLLADRPILIPEPSSLPWGAVGLGVLLFLRSRSRQND